MIRFLSKKSYVSTRLDHSMLGNDLASLPGKSGDTVLPLAPLPYPYDVFCSCLMTCHKLIFQLVKTQKEIGMRSIVWHLPFENIRSHDQIALK